MKKYTIGIYFVPSLSHCLLIEKQKPEWQKGHYNFPGGKIEEGESPHDCVAREFKEECGIKIDPTEWHHIGEIEGDGYSVAVMTAIKSDAHGDAQTLTNESVRWFNIDHFPEKIISNLHWLKEFAHNFHKQGLNGQDRLMFGIFKYE